MPNLLLAISGICIVAFVLRETLEDLQRKRRNMTAIMFPPTSRANAL